MTQAQEIIQTLEECFRDRSIDTQSPKSGFKDKKSYRCQWKSEELKVRAEIFYEDANRIQLNSLLVEKNITNRAEDYLTVSGQAICQRLTYLPESLQMIESSPASNSILCRSAHPEVRSGEISYFELILKHGAWFGYRNLLSLRRFETRRITDEPRVNVPFVLTKAQMVRFVGDLIDIL